MNILYFLAGLFSGVSIVAFFLGKKLYHYYIINKIQKKQLGRLLKLNDKLKKTKFQ